MSARHPGLVREIRGKGLMVGMELSRPGAALAERCLAAGLLVNCTHDTVMRFAPAMNIGRRILDEGLDIYGDCLEKFAAGG